VCVRARVRACARARVCVAVLQPVARLGIMVFNSSKYSITC
jgi:hypothetical protein